MKSLPKKATRMIETSPELTRLVAQVVAAYVSNNKLDVGEIPSLMQQVHQSFLRLDHGAARAAAPAVRPDPAVPVKKSVTPEYIICLEDGKKMKMLKRHLQSAYNMSPEQYRERWNLPADYPMVAPNYARERSNLAKNFGLGTLAKGKK